MSEDSIKKLVMKIADSNATVIIALVIVLVSAIAAPLVAIIAMWVVITEWPESEQSEKDIDDDC